MELAAIYKRVVGLDVHQAQITACALMLEFMQRLTALVPRPRLNLIRFHGVLAPNAKVRSEIIPGNKQNKSNVSDTNDAVPHPPASVRISWQLGAFAKTGVRY